MKLYIIHEPFNHILSDLALTQGQGQCRSKLILQITPFRIVTENWDKNVAYSIL